MNQTRREQWEEEVLKAGFKLILEEPVQEARTIGDKLRIYWDRGVLLVSDSWNGDSELNSAELYFCFEPIEDEIPDSSSYQFITEGRYFVRRDARTAIRYYLQEARKKGKIHKSWIPKRRLWLLSYSEMNRVGHLQATSMKCASNLAYELSVRRWSLLPPKQQRAIGKISER